MKKLSSLAGLLLVSLIFTGCGDVKQHAAKVDRDSACQLDLKAFENVQTYFDRAEAFGFSGVILLRKAGCPSISKAYGYADEDTNRKIKSDTVFLTGSITKIFTATAILKLKEEGRVGLDEPVNAYLDYIPDDKASITIAHLLTHRSGLDEDYWDRNRDLTERQYVEMILARDLNSVPGEEYRYNNFGYHLLKLVIEKVTGISYQEYLQQELFGPVGIKDIGFAIPGWRDEDVAFYQSDRTRLISEKFNVDLLNPLNREVYLQPEGSGAVMASAPALADFVDAVAAGKIVQGGFSAYSIGENHGVRDYGLAFRDTPLGLLVGHGGFDDAVNFATRFGYFPESQTTFVVFTNTTMGGGLSSEIIEYAVLSTLQGEEIELPPEAAALEGDISLLSGIYVSDHGQELKIRNRGEDGWFVEADGESNVSLLAAPALWADAEASLSDDVLAFVTAMEEGDRETFMSSSWENIRTERYYNRVQASWREVKDALGPVKSFRFVHKRGFLYEGEIEDWTIVGAVHEKGRSLLRVIANEEGLFYINVASPPESVSLKLGRIDDARYATWDPRMNMSVMYRLSDDGGRLIVGGKDAGEIYLNRQ
jgi:CubicO group peptidase (beta-lactamase class C family)